MTTMRAVEVSDDGRGALEQLNLIENMIQEGRRTTEYWGWNFLLWGTAYLVAMAWSSFFESSRSAVWAWPVMMASAAVLSGIIISIKTKGKPVTTVTRALQATWTGIGLGIFVFAFPATFGHHFGDGHAFIAAIEALLGAAHVASGMILRWRLQVAIGGVWWSAALVANLTQTVNGAAVPFLVATLICNIGFGGYLMYLEARDKARMRAGQVAHA